MSQSQAHNALIRNAARRILAPIGLSQRGRSRVWLDDHGWWLIVVEFQPSRRGRGTYLNVGAMWLWRPTGDLSFEFGGRVGGFVDLENVSDPAAAVDKVASLAASEVDRVRLALRTPLQMARELGNQPGAGEWQLLHAAIAAAVGGNPDLSARALARIHPPKPDAPEWQRDLWQDVQLLRSERSNRVALEARLNEAVRESRSSLRLPDWNGAVPFASRPAA